MMLTFLPRAVALLDLQRRRECTRAVTSALPLTTPQHFKRATADYLRFLHKHLDA